MRVWAKELGRSDRRSDRKCKFLRYTGVLKKESEEVSSDDDSEHDIEALSGVLHEQQVINGPWMWRMLSPLVQHRPRHHQHTVHGGATKAAVNSGALEAQKIESSLVKQYKCAIVKHFGGNRRQACESIGVDSGTINSWSLLH